VTAELWNLKSQGWAFVVTLAVLNLVLDLISLLGATTWHAVMFSVIVNAIVLIDALTPGVKEAFRIPTRPA
jgi:membrane-bound ClpP family serine protease